MSEQTRAYRSELRSAQAARTRQQILNAAAGEFARRGYAGATLAGIARAAGVSVESVKLQGLKHELLLGAFEWTFSGRESREQIFWEPWAQELLGETANADLIPVSVALLSEMNARSNGLHRAFTGAAQSDSAVEALYQDLQDRRNADFNLLIAELARRGMIRSTRPHGELAAELSFLTSPEGYQQLVVEHGWSLEKYRTWLIRAIELLILAD